MTPENFRQLALAIPATVEGAHMNHPDFRIAGKIFASLGVPDEAWGMVKVSPEQQQQLVAEAPKAFRPCNGAWGRQGCTNVHLASVSESTLRTALVAAAHRIAAETEKKPRAKDGSRSKGSR